MLEVIGWIGAACFALCAVPQAWECYKKGHGRGLSKAFLWLWVVGEVCTLAYMIPKLLWPPIANLAANLVFLVVILKYVYFPRRL